MMAGHPNDASPVSLRNFPFAFIWEETTDAYNRNGIAAEWGQLLGFSAYKTTRRVIFTMCRFMKGWATGWNARYHRH
jgi:hypothetical protein